VTGAAAPTKGAAKKGPKGPSHKKGAGKANRAAAAAAAAAAAKAQQEQAQSSAADCEYTLYYFCLLHMVQAWCFVCLSCCVKGCV
jgi:hypothetical protein